MLKTLSLLRLPTTRHFVIYWLPVIIYAALIFSISSIPIRVRQVPFKYYDKVFHFFEYAFFALIWFRAIRATFPNFSIPRAGTMTFVICSAMGALDEVYQMFTPFRVSDIYDLAADATGSFTAVVLAGLIKYVLRT